MKKIYLLTFFALSVFFATAQVNLNDSLYIYYKFDNDVLDYSGKQNHGTNHNSTGTTDRCGNPNSALQFNGVDNWVSIYPPLPDMNSYSIHTWIYYSDSTKGWRGIFSDSDPTVFYDVFLNITDTLIEIIYDKTTNGAAATIYSNKNFLNSWHQLVWVNTGTVSKIYVDTVLVHTNNTAGQNIGYHDTAYVGKMCDGNNSLRFFKGKIDEFRLYTRALNTEEIATLYNLSCEATGINEEKSMQNITIYPNPADDFLYFTSDIHSVSGIEIYNALGQQMTCNFRNANTIDISKFPQGNYTVCFKAGQQIIKKQFAKF
jgi:hypothetical protein